MFAGTQPQTHRVNNNLFHYRTFSNFSFILFIVSDWVFLIILSSSFCLYSAQYHSCSLVCLDREQRSASRHLTASLYHLCTSNNQRGKDMRGNRKEECMMTEESQVLDTSIYWIFFFFFLHSQIFYIADFLQLDDL